MNTLTKPQKDLRSQLEKNLNVMKSQLVEALPRNMNVDRFNRIVVTEVTKNPKLLECNPSSFFCSLLLAAQMGLEVGSATGHCYLIPFKVKGKMECQFILGYKGMIEIACRSGKIKSIVAELIYENDTCEIEIGGNRSIKHRPTFKDRGEVIAGHSMVTYDDNSTAFIWMTNDELDKVRESSKSGSYGPWLDDTNEMKKKTLIRRHYKSLPTNIVSLADQKLADQDEKIKTKITADIIETQEIETYEEVEAKIIEDEENLKATPETKKLFFEWLGKNGLSPFLSLEDNTGIQTGCDRSFLEKSIHRTT